jgi:aryl-alcohol dehydrogenase-like predicted oxidoreductase
MNSISRRAFSSRLAAGAAGFVLGCRSDTRESSDGSGPRHAPGQSGEAPTIQRFRSLGDTGIHASDIIFGANTLNDPGIVRYAFDRGINVFDTAANYSSGVSEEILAEGLRGVRDGAHVITKQGVNPRRRANVRRIERTLEASLRNLQSDYVDGLFIHSMDSMDPLNNDDVVEAFVRFKREGKVRFTGFSTHREAVTLAQCVAPQYSEFVDAVMFRYNHVESAATEPLVARMRSKGIGTIAMKTLAAGTRGLSVYTGDTLSENQAAIAWALANENVDCAVLTMDTYASIDEYVGASGVELTR